MQGQRDKCPAPAAQPGQENCRFALAAVSILLSCANVVKIADIRSFFTTKKSWFNKIHLQPGLCPEFHSPRLPSQWGRVTPLHRCHSAPLSLWRLWCLHTTLPWHWLIINSRYLYVWLFVCLFRFDFDSFTPMTDRSYGVSQVEPGLENGFEKNLGFCGFLKKPRKFL